MPRIARIVYPELPHHITQRGNFKHNIFISEDDIIQYVKLIEVANKHLKIEILAYCFMMNHVHFIMVPPEEESLAFFFNSLSMRYAQYFNRKLGRKGHLWQDRYYSCPLDSRHFYEAVRYVENNPVKAGIVKYAAEYRWSSASIHIDGNYNDSSLLTRNSRHLDDLKIQNWKEYLETDSNKDLISNIKSCTSSGKPAGSKDFIEKIEQVTGRVLINKRRGRPSIK